MILAVEVIMFVAGATALVLGRFPLRAGAVNTNLGGRLAGLVLMAPIPIAFVVGMSMAQAARGESYFEFWSKLIAVELAIVLGCLVVGYMIAILTHDPFAVTDARLRRKREQRLEKRLRRANVRDRDEDDEEESRSSAWVPVAIVLGALLLIVGVGIAIVASMSGGQGGGAPCQGVFGQGQPQQPGAVAQMQQVVSKVGRWQARAPVPFHGHGTEVRAPYTVTRAHGNLGETFYYVYHFDIPSLPVNLTPTERAEAAERLRRELFQGAIFLDEPKKSQPATVAGFPGHEVVVDRPQANSARRARVVLAHGQFFMITVAGPPAGVNSSESTAFLESLEIIPPGQSK